HVLEPYLVLVREALRLRRARYDLAVVFRADHWWGALLALVAGIPVRVGGRTSETERLLTHAAVLTPTEHAVEQALGIANVALDAFGVAAETAPCDVVFRVDEEARAEAARWWSQHGLDGQRVVAIQPSAGAALKSWPLGRWRALAAGLDDAVLMTGGPDDAALLRQVAAGAAVACGQRLAVTAALFERCALVIAPDGGAGHLAAAVGTPTLRLYGPAPTSKFGPWPKTARHQQVLVTGALDCLPCGYLERPPCGARTEPACMLALSVDQVLATAKGMLARIEN
ncbi:MAG TPA: glycosyltransferase family 9 protein, partial [Chloroflexota bacterium]